MLGFLREEFLVHGSWIYHPGTVRQVMRAAAQVRSAR